MAIKPRLPTTTPAIQALLAAFVGAGEDMGDDVGVESDGAVLGGVLVLVLVGDGVLRPDRMSVGDVGDSVARKL
jgi:hypothetical protein